MELKTQRLRVVFCAYDFPNYVGGPNAWLLRLLPQLATLGIECHVLFFTQDSTNSPTAEALLEKGVSSTSFPFAQTSRKKVNWILKKVLANPPDIFVPNLVVPAYFAGGWIRAAGVPTIGILHSDDEFYHAIVEEFCGKSDFFRLSGLVCVSDYLMDTVRPKVSVDTPVFNIPYGVPIPTEEAPEPIEDLKIIYVGRLEEEQKRVSDLAHAFCQMVKKVPGTSARIYGDGPAVTSIARILRQEDPIGKVRLMGRVPSDEIQSHMLTNHVVVLLSDYEGLPIALLEAMACGLVPVCLRIPSGIPQLIRDGETGLLVSDRGESFVSAIKLLKTSPDRWRMLSQNARDEIIKSYSDQACASRWFEALIEVASQGSKAEFQNVPAARRLPNVRREFLREDFRAQHLPARIFRKLDRLVRKLVTLKFSRR